MSQNFSQYINIIGKGKKSGQCLTREQAYQAMKMLLAGEVTGEQRGAFLMLLRTREETPEEIIGFTDACRATLNPELSAIKVDLDIGCYAGKRRQLPWYLLAVASLSHAGYSICLHGAEESGTKRLYASHMLPELGLELATSISQATKDLQQKRACYLDLSLCHQALYDVIQLRPIFGLRSCANTLARLLNPTGAICSVQGVHHVHLDEKHSKVNQAYPAIRSLCFRGDGGDPEVNQQSKTDLYFSIEGEEVCITMPEGATWAMKEQELSANTMLSLWRDESEHKYAVQAILGSLTAYLMLLDDLDLQSATKKSRDIWQARPRSSMPF